MLQVRLLGQFNVRVGGMRVTISSRAGQSLFAFLILTAGTAHRREKLSGQFWPDTSDNNARRNLRQELWRIRKALVARQPSTADYLLAEELTLTFNSDADYWLDVAQLERPLSPSDDLNQPISQVALYQGELLPGLYDDWVVLERERLQALFESRMRQLLERLIEEQRWVTVLEWAERWIALGSTPEPAYRALMLAFAALGDKSKVISTYERCVEALDKELSVEPSDETRALHDQLRRGQVVAGVDLSATRVSLARAPALDDPPAPGEPPFKGLQYFDEADAALFFGRELLTAKLIGHLRESRFLAVVVGASGSGKSSIVRAGVIPALRRSEPLADGALPPEGSAQWQMHVITPTAHPLEALAVSLTRDSESITATATLMDDLARDARSLYLFTRRASALSENASHLLLVVDQFEELFTLCRDAFEREAFIDNLLAAVAPDSGGRITLVITIRADFYPHLAQYRELRDAVAQYQEYIGPMTVEELRRAIEEPAKRGGADGVRWEFQPGLVDVMLRDVGDEPGALPLLSHALLETWQRRSGRVLTLKGYADSGGVRGAIAHTAETVYQALTSTQQALARHIFLRLTELGEGTEDTRRRAPLRELVTHPADESALRVVLTKLADARLITTGEEGAEVAHEALIREWPTLREWLTQDREGLLLHRHLTEAAREWELLERDPGVLYRGARLAQASEWAQTHSDDMNVLEREFLESSQALTTREAAEREAQQLRELEAARQLAETEKARAGEQARAAGQLRRRALYLAGAFILAIAMAGTALFFGEQARQNAVTAQREQRIAFSRELAAAAISNLNVDPERSILLALQAVNETYQRDQLILSEAETALHQALLASHVRLTITAHTGPVWSVAYSPDGTRFATASDDGTAKIWDAATGKEVLTLDIMSAVSSILFSPDGTRLATGSDDGLAHVWDATTGQALLRLDGHRDAVKEVAFSPDSKRLATADGGEVVKVWDLTSGASLLTLTGWHVSYSPDGTRLATTLMDGTLKIWDASSGQELLTWPEAILGEVFQSAFFSPDGTRLAMARDAATARVRDAVTGEEVLILAGHTNNLHSLTFSPDGTRLATTSQDRSAIVWDATTGNQVLQLWGHRVAVYGAAFSPDGKRLVTGDEAGAIKVWDVTPDQELLTLISPPGTEVSRVLFSPDGSRLFVAYEYTSSGGSFPGSPGLVRVLNATTGEEVLTLPRPTIIVGQMAVSPDGALLAISTRDATPKVWEAATGREVLTLSGHTDEVRGITFSPDGKRLATGSLDGTAKVWDLASGQALMTLTGHTDAVLGVAFSPDGTRLATTSWDRTAKVWDLASGRVVFTLSGHTDDVIGVAFDPNGKYIATGSRDGTARLWDAVTGRELFILRGHTSTVFSLDLSPDGKRVVTASTDGTLKLWNTTTGKELVTLPGNPTVAFSPDGTRLATGSRGPKERGVLRLYLRQIEDLMALAQSRVTRSLTIEECQKYLHVEECPQP